MNTVVYQWLREDGSPYYIGIGSPRRPYTGKRNCGGPPPRDRIVILCRNLDWEEACKIERELITFYGRKDLGTGILRNLTDGGEGSCGVVMSEETKAKISKAVSGENHPLYGKRGEKSYWHGKTHSEETKAKMSKARSGENHHMYGKKHTEEAKAKMSRAHLGRRHSEETRKKMSGENHNMYGKKHTEETKAKISKALSGENHPMYGKKRTEESRAKISGKNNPRYTPRDWYHPIHGEVLQKSISELAEMFPEQKLLRSSLSTVCSGKRNHHKGWKVLSPAPLVSHSMV